MTEVANTKIRTAGGFCELPEIRLIRRAIKVSEPIITSTMPNNLTPDPLGSLI